MSFLWLTLCCLVAQWCPTLCNHMDCSTLGFPSFTFSQSWFELMFIELMLISNHLVLHCSLHLLSSIFPSIRVFSSESVLASGDQSIGASASTSVLPMNIQDWFPLGLVGSPCCPRDFQESSPTPQFKNINSLALSFLYGPTLTSIHDYWIKP